MHKYWKVTILFLIISIICLTIRYFEPYNSAGKIYYINLDKNIPRNENMINQFKKHNIDNYERFTGINGYNMTKTEKLMFPNNCKLRPGEQGCFLSHYNLWKKLSESNYMYFVIFEDDVYFKNNINQMFKDIDKFVTKNYETIDGVIYLYHTKPDAGKPNTFTKLETTWVDQGAIAYVITNAMAEKLVDLVEDKNTPWRPIDMYPVEFFDNMYLYNPSSVTTHNFGSIIGH